MCRSLVTVGYRHTRRNLQRMGWSRRQQCRTLSSTQNLMFVGCILRPLLPGDARDTSDTDGLLGEAWVTPHTAYRGQTTSFRGFRQPRGEPCHHVWVLRAFNGGIELPPQEFPWTHERLATSSTTPLCFITSLRLTPSPSAVSRAISPLANVRNVSVKQISDAAFTAERKERSSWHRYAD